MIVQVARYIVVFEERIYVLAYWRQIRCSRLYCTVVLSACGPITAYLLQYYNGKAPEDSGKDVMIFFGRAVTYDSNNNSEILYLGMSELRGKKISSSKQPIASLDFVSTQIERPMTIDDEKL